jgi:hypothetical protein
MRVEESLLQIRFFCVLPSADLTCDVRAMSRGSPTRAGTLIAVRETARSAGFFAAHGIWSVFDGATLTPVLGYEQADGSRGMDRFVSDDIAEAVLTGQDALEANRRGSARAVLVTDAYVQLDTGRTDALIVEAVEYGPARQSMKMAVPLPPGICPGGLCRVPAQVH